MGRVNRLSLSMESDTLKPCCVCNQESGNVVVEYRIKSYDVLRCLRCGLRYVNETFVASCGEGIVENHETVGVPHAGYWMRRFQKNLEQIESLVPVGRILDIGCHHGYFLAVAKEHGWQTSGLDLDGYAVKLAQAKGIDARLGVFQEMDYRAGEFDVVTAYYVIEHQSDPVSFVTRAFELLRPGGLLVLEAPTDDFLIVDVASAIYRLSGGRLSTALPYLYNSTDCGGHVYRFSTGTIQQLLGNAGYTAITVSPADNPAFGLYLAKRNYGQGFLRRQVNRAIFGATFAGVRILGLHSRMAVFARKPFDTSNSP